MAVIFVEGFEKHSPANLNFVTNLFDGATTYDLANQSLLKDWTQFTSGGNGAHISFQLGRGGAVTSRSIFATAQGAGAGSLRRTLPTTYSRGIAGVAIMTGLFGTPGFAFMDSGTTQVGVYVDTIGRIVVHRNGTVLATSTQSVKANVWNYVEMDATVNNTTGAFEVWLNGVSILSATGQNTRATANNNFNQFILDFSAGLCWFDDVYLFDTTGGANNAARGDSQVQTLWPTSDDSKQFTPTYSIGYFPRQTLNGTNAPGANTLTLVPMRPDVNCTLDSIQLNCQTTSAGAKVKGVVYSDSSGNPGSLLSDGTEVTGTTSGTNLNLPLATPQSLTGGTQYWIGFYSDTSLTVGTSEITFNVGQKKANTYGSGAPAGPLTGMTTAQPTWQIWGIASSAASNYAVVNEDQVANVVNGLPTGRNESSTAAHEDLFNASDLVGTIASVACVQLSGILSKDTAGARTADLRIKSNVTTSSGGSSGFAVTTTPVQYASVYETDPDTAAAWGSSGVNAMKIGYKVAS